MTVRNQWLQQELAQWEREGLVDANQVAALRQRYPLTDSATDLATDPAAESATESPNGPSGLVREAAEESPSWTGMLLPLIGAILVGLGVILFFAYNWAAIPKAFKLIAVFGSLIGSHWLGMFFARPNRRNPLLSQTFHILGTMLFGAGIWLIAQIYHMDEHYPTGILAWGAGALLLAWALPSLPQAILAAALFAVWSGSETLAFSRVNVGGSLVYLLGLLPLAWWMKSRALVFFSLAGFIITSTLSLSVFYQSFSLHLVFVFSCLLLALSTLVYRTNFPASAAPIRAAGFIGYAFLLFAFSFGRNHGLLPFIQDPLRFGQSVYWSLIGLTVLAWIASVVAGAFTREGATRTWINVMIVIAFTLVVLIRYLPQYPQTGVVVMLIFNVLIIGHAIALIQAGAEKMSWKQTTLGFLILGLLIAARFTDLFSSLLARSLAFLVFGLTLFAVGYWISRRKRKLAVGHA